MVDWSSAAALARQRFGGSRVQRRELAPRERRRLLEESTRVRVTRSPQEARYGFDARRRRERERVLPTVIEGAVLNEGDARLEHRPTPS